MIGQRLNPSYYFPCFQPIVDLVTGHIGGYEALARYRDDRGKLCSAGMLFQDPTLPKESVLAVDRHLRELALQQFSRDTHAGYLTINVSPDWIGLLNGGTSPTIAMIEASGIDPKRVVVEITEGQGELEQIQRLVDIYHEAGIRVAIDDFGAGASQIDRIMALKPDIIKLDMQLFKRAARGGITADVTLAAASIAERIGCEIVCEGVETPEELHFGIECGARYVQGYIFYPAGPELLPSKSPYEAVRAIQKSFLQRKAELLQVTAAHARRINDCVLDIRQHLTHRKSKQLSPGKLFKEGVLRYYLCRADGTQTSDNFEVTGSGFHNQPWGKGCNWSHRPYFPLLLALRSSGSGELVVSNKYRDTITHTLCKTYCTYIDENLVLLVDVAVDDDVLYATVDQAGHVEDNTPPQPMLTNHKNTANDVTPIKNRASKAF